MPTQTPKPVETPSLPAGWEELAIAGSGDRTVYISLPEKLRGALEDYGGEETQLVYEDGCSMMVASYLMADSSFAYFSQLGLKEDDIIDLLAEAMMSEFEGGFDSSEVTEHKDSETVNGFTWRTYLAEGQLRQNGENASFRVKVYFYMDDGAMVIFAVGFAVPEGTSSEDARDFEEWYSTIPTTLRYEQ